jgi:hypothetical protein
LILDFPDRDLQQANREGVIRRAPQPGRFNRQGEGAIDGKVAAANSETKAALFVEPGLARPPPGAEGPGRAIARRSKIVDDSTRRGRAYVDEAESPTKPEFTLVISTANRAKKADVPSAALN